METTRRQFIARTSVAAAGTAFGLSAAPAHAGGTPVAALTGATVIDPSDGTTRRHQTVLIRDDRIVAVGHVPVPHGARVVDLQGSYVIPTTHLLTTRG